MSNNVMRVRLVFDCLRPKKVNLSVVKCWMMVDFNICKLVKDLERVILERFFANESVKLKLSVDDFLLPADEVINIVHENDIIRVEVSDDRRSKEEDEDGFCCPDNQESVADEKSKKKKKKRKRKLSETGESSSAILEDSSKRTYEKSIPTEGGNHGNKSKKHKKKKRGDNEDGGIDDISRDYKESDSQMKPRTNKKKDKKQDKCAVSDKETEWTENVAGTSSRNKIRDKSKMKKKTTKEAYTVDDSGDRNPSKTAHKSGVPNEDMEQMANVADMPTRKGTMDKSRKTAKEAKTVDDSGEGATKKSAHRVTQEKSESGKSKKSASTSNEELKSPKQISKGKNLNKDGCALEQKAGNRSSRKVGSPLTRQDISKTVEHKVSNKPVGQRLLEISQVSNVSLLSPRIPSERSKGHQSRSKPTKRSQGHIRFSSSSDESSSEESSSDSSSESDSEPMSSGSKKLSSPAKSLPVQENPQQVASTSEAMSLKEGGKQSLTLEKSLPVHEAHSRITNGESSDLKSLADLTSHQMEANRTTDEPISDAIPKDKALQCGPQPDSSEAQSLITMATENGIHENWNGSVTNQTEGWRGGGQHHGRRRKQGMWNLLSKTGQLNTQLSNKSIVIENPKAVDTAPETTDAAPVAPVKPKDYAVYPALIGPPRTGDKIAYKTLELSNIYCPEVSQYKEAEVMGYDPTNQAIEVKLTNDPQPPVKRQGRFELHFDNEEEEEAEAPCELNNLVSIQLSSLIEPKLL